MATRPALPPIVDPVQAYLRNISRDTLLSPDEEVLLGRQVQQYMTLCTVKDTLAHQLQRQPTDGEWADAAATTLGLELTDFRQTLQRGRRAREKMINANLRLVVNVAKQYQHRNMELLDLIQEGTLGLVRGVELFDPTKGYRLSTYAYWWIRQAMTRAIANQSRSIRLPIHIHDKLAKLKKTQGRLAQRLGRPATLREVAAEMDMDIAQLQELLGYLSHPHSLDVPLCGEDPESCYLDCIASPISAMDEALAADLRGQVQLMLSCLTARERQVLELRFGLNGGQEHQLREVAGQLKITRQRVSALQTDALRKLRTQGVVPCLSP